MSKRKLQSLSLREKLKLISVYESGKTNTKTKKYVHQYAKSVKKSFTVGIIYFFIFDLFVYRYILYSYEFYDYLSRMSRKLADKDVEQLLAALEDGNISEDGLEDESEDEETFFANAREIIQELEDEDAEDHEDPTYSDPSLVQDLPGPSSQIIISLPMQEGIQQYVEFDKRKLIWKKDSLLFDESKIIH